MTNVVEAVRAAAELAAGDFDSPEWALARPAHLARYWSGEPAPEGRRAEARLLWTAEALVARFDCRQTEPLVTSPAPRLDRKTIGLWERDVCELFVTPEQGAVGRYFEFEAAPTGEWLDLAVSVRGGALEKDWHYRSGMTAAARAGEGSVVVGLSVPWKSVGGAPRAGERWRANLFRCVGSGPGRGYLAWQPTHTEEPFFHVPEKFGWLKFK